MARRNGFTMIETLLVLVIIGTVAAIGLPRLDLYKYRSDATAVMVRSLLMQAQREAVVGQHDVILSIDTVGHRMILGFDKNNDGNVVLSERIRTQALPDQNRFSVPPRALGTPGLNAFGGIHAEALRSTSGYPSVAFRRDGSVSSALELYTTSARSRAKDYRAITVIQATGRTEFFRYDGSSWVRAQ